MQIKELLKNLISKTNPLAYMRRKKMRSSLINTQPSFLCPNCIGGILFHDLGLQFRSPTINTMMEQQDFAKFVSHLDHYLQQELIFFQKDGFDCPCAHLDDIDIHFTHYQTPEEAAEKWNARKERIDFKNLFIFLSERDQLTPEDIRNLANIQCRGLVVFTANSYPDIPYTLHVPALTEGNVVGNVLQKSWKDESRAYEHYFDFIKWFNEANGSPYSIAPFAK